jgi:hypothetical protein
MKTKLSIGLFLVNFLFAPVLAQTNQYYIYDESVTPYLTNTIFTAEQIAKAKNAIDSGPVENDPNGNWGKVLEGFQLSIRFNKFSFTNGEPITAMVTLRNVTNKLLWYPVSYGEDTETTFVLMKGQDQVLRKDEPHGTNFFDRVRAVHRGSEGSWASPVGTQRKFPFELNTIYDLNTNGEYLVQAKRKIPNIAQNAVVEITSGRATIQIITKGKTD